MKAVDLQPWLALWESSVITPRNESVIQEDTGEENVLGTYIEE